MRQDAFPGFRLLRPHLCRSSLTHSMIALGLVALVTLGLAVVDHFFALRHVSIVYLIPVVIAATQLGVVPAVIAAIAGIAASAFFFYPPIYDFRVHDPHQLIELPFFIFVAIVTSHLATSLKRQVEISRQRETEMRDLAAFSRRLAVAYAARDIYAAIEDHLSSVLHRRVILIPSDGYDTAESQLGLPENVHRAAIAIAGGHAVSDTATVVDVPGGGAWLVRRVSPQSPDFGVVAIDLGDEPTHAIDAVRNRVDAVLADASATLERLDLGRAINEARLRAGTEALRDALIGSVSHELRTPLASILGAATVLAKAPAANDDTRRVSLANIIRDEAERLDTDIQNLLHASRISSEGVRPRPEWVDPADVLNAAIERRRRRLADHTVALSLGEDLPLVHADPVMMEQALGQILDNAAKYSPSGSTIRVAGRCHGGSIVLSVSDEGFGFTDEERERLWERFFRGRRTAAMVSGSGLGLWIAQAFVKANGGSLEALSEGADRGATLSIHLPAASQMPGATR